MAGAAMATRKQRPSKASVLPMQPPCRERDLKHTVPKPDQDKSDTDDAIDDHAPRNIPLWNVHQAEPGAIMMGEIPESMRKECCRDEPGADPDAKQRRDGEQE